MISYIERFYAKEKKVLSPNFFFFFGKVNRTRHKVKKEKKRVKRNIRERRISELPLLFFYRNYPP